MNHRMNRSRLNIGAYILQPYARTEAHIRDVVDCGVDFIVGMGDDRPALDLFAKYGLGAIVSGVLPGWWGGNGDNAGTMAEKNPLSKYDEIADTFVDHPAIWGIDTGDEPSALDFPHYGKVIDLVSRRFPTLFPYINLYPNYASVAENTGEQTINQLGTPTYEEHIAEYVRNVPTDYICYDFYLYSKSAQRAFINLWTVSDACRTTGRSLWIVLQVNSNPSRRTQILSANQIRFQAYTAMAFGAENIIWGCYTAGWWYNNVLDTEGNKTEQYDKLREVNAELHTLGEVYMRYRRTDTYFLSFPEEMRNSKEVYSDGFISELRSENKLPLIVGSMVERNGGSHAYMLCSCDDHMDQNPQLNNVSFRLNGRTAVLHRPTGAQILLPDADGKFSFDLPSNHGALLEIIE